MRGAERGSAIGADAGRRGAGAILLWSAIFVLFLVLTQSANLTEEQAGWDESTFILMAAEIQRGHLPYVTLVDVKPPIMFFALAGVMEVFGSSIEVVRIFGDACMSVVAVFSFLIARRWSGDMEAGLAVLALLGAATPIFFQATLTEHVAMAFLMPALWLALDRPNGVGAAACAGALVSLAVLTRLNLGFAAAGLGIWYLAAGWRRGGMVPRGALPAFVAGGLAPLGLLILLYASAGALDALRLGLLDLPLAYTSREGVGTTILSHLVAAGLVLKTEPFIYGPLLLLVPAAAWSLWRGRDAVPWAAMAPVAAAAGGVIVSFLLGGAAFPHYWLQVFPLVVPLIAIAMTVGGRIRMAIVILVALAAGAALVREGPDSVAVLAEPDALREAHEIRHAARAVSTELRPGDTVLAVTGHLIHWYLDRPPPSPIAHPSNLVSADMIGVLVAADRIGPEPFAVLLESRPAFVVRHGDRTPRWLRLAGWATRFEAMLAEDYEPFFNEGQITVWRRR